MRVRTKLAHREFYEHFRTLEEEEAGSEPEDDGSESEDGDTSLKTITMDVLKSMLKGQYGVEYMQQVQVGAQEVSLGYE